MPAYSQSSLSKLSTCHVDLQKIFFEVIKHYDCTIIEGFRNEQAQENAFKNGKTTIHWPNGNHNHSPSRAVDVAPYPVRFDENIKNNFRYYHFAGFVKGISAKLLEEGKIISSIRWGGDWNGNNDFSDQKFNDFVHFELIGA